MNGVESKGLDEVLRKLKKLPELTRLATVRATNDTLVEAQTFTTQKLLPEKFTLRGRGKRWFEKGQKLGFNIRFAKMGSENIEGALGSQADFLKLQEEGGTKTAGQHRVAIPDQHYKPKQDIMRADMKPRAILKDKNQLQALKAAVDQTQGNLARASLLLEMHRGVRLATKADKQRRHDLKLQLRIARQQAKKADKAHRAVAGTGAETGSSAFMATMSSGFVGIFKRPGKGRFPLKLLFSFKKYTHIEARLAFEKAAGALANERYDENFRKRFLEAMK